ncbi:MAG: hypothetical protein KGQ41_04070 [Alphaproteobacteria bacterium]|nr:hypothetical protein [Alphaproteobacteria bacterium]
MTDFILKSRVLFLLSFLGAFLFFAQQSVYADCANFAAAMGQSENSGNTTGCTPGNNGANHCGLYQFSDTLRRQYGYSESMSAEQQTEIFNRYMDDNWRQLNSGGRNAESYIGMTDQFGTTITKTGILAVSHLGGVGGASEFLRCSQNQSANGCPYNPADGPDMGKYAKPEVKQACRDMRDQGIGVADRNKTPNPYVPPRFNPRTGKMEQPPYRCGTFLSDYLAKFAGDENGNCGNGRAGQNSNPQQNQQCSPRLAEMFRNANDAALAKKTDIFMTVMGPPITPQYVQNTPCKSREIQRISNQFSYAPSFYAADALGQLNGLLGPVSGIMNNFLGADMQALMRGSQNIGGLAGQMFQNFAQSSLNNMMQSIGLADTPFAAALCGIMADAILSYVMCEAQFKLPSLGRLTGSLNKLLPKGCAGEAVRKALYSAASESALKPTNNGILFGPSGMMSGPGSQSSPNGAIGPWTPTVRR